MSKKNLLTIELFVAIYWLTSLSSIILNTQLESSFLNQAAFFVLVVMNIPIFIVYRMAAIKHDLPLASRFIKVSNSNQAIPLEQAPSDLRTTQF